MKCVGLEKWVIDPVRRSGEDFKETIIAAWNQREVIRENIEKMVPELEDQSRQILNRMIEAIKLSGAGS
jgi:hypothetical protein